MQQRVKVNLLRNATPMTIFATVSRNFLLLANQYFVKFHHFSSSAFP